MSAVPYRCPQGASLARTDWAAVLAAEFDEPYWEDLCDFVDAERRTSVVYPEAADVFGAFALTSYASTAVVIVGQDPYHGPGQAHGLSFSVRAGVAIPPSLRNIHAELESDLGLAAPGHGSLEAWARQGVLLLNATLTVRAHEPGSHRGRGWERFTAAVIRALDARDDPVVFVLWGAGARRSAELVSRERHTVLESAHPSPLSARRGFFGSRPFSRANEALRGVGSEPVDWQLDG
jgi:uracil-DNA glycosylase